MPSPFPGMDPYIEAYGDWADLNACLVTYCCASLNERLPENYVARVTSRLKLVRAEGVDFDEARMSSDLHRAPGKLPIHHDEIRESSVQILRYPERRLVTHIEVLSPTNKRNPGRGEYLAKHTALIHQQKVNMVEIDLLLGGERLATVEPLPPADYYAFVTRAHRLPKVDVYAWSVRQALPPIPIPLLPPDADVPIDLAVLVTQVYDRGRYAQLIAYDKVAPKGIGEGDRAWVEQLASAARR
jgi:hypothetical protein